MIRKCQRKKRRNQKSLYTHIRSKHRNEIIAKALPDRMSVDNQECVGSVCKKVYCRKSLGKKLWCKKCLNDLKLVKEMKKESKAGLCPECGLSVRDLNRQNNHHHAHNIEKQICNVCSLEFSCLEFLNKHKKNTHEKVPCTQCGKFFGAIRMNRHIQAVHTPDNEKKYRCDTCDKGFVENQRLSEHLNIHTGEKPFKCKLCPASFASQGTHAMHERGHIGSGRKNCKCKLVPCIHFLDL